MMEFILFILSLERSVMMPVIQISLRPSIPEQLQKSQDLLAVQM